MSFSLKDRHLFGAGAAACAVCCAAPVLTLLGVAGAAGAAATAATFVFAGAVFGLAVAAGALLAVLVQRRQRSRESCTTVQAPVDVELSMSRPLHDT